MKIGIITIHFPYNYGAMLQAYALKTYLEKNGHDVDVLDYRPYFIDKYYHFYYKNIVHNPKGFIKSIFNINQPDRNSFEGFLNDRILDNKHIDIRMINNSDYDILITGSDQVWNPDITGRDTTYFLDFAQKFNCKKIAYAPSIALQSLDDLWKQTIVKWCRQYDYISLREKDEIESLKEFVEIDIAKVADPTFLLCNEEWERVEVKPRNFSVEKYILLYRLQENESLNKKVKEYKEKTDLSIISIYPFKTIDTLADETLYDIGPAEFLWLVHHANAVFTNSFHGTALSINYKTPFLTLLHTKTGSRMKNLLNSFQLELDEDGLYRIGNNNDELISDFIAESKSWLNNAVGS